MTDRVDLQLALAMAEKYHSLGLQLVPLPIGQKAHKVKWTAYVERPQTIEDVRAFFSEPRNTGIYCGAQSGNFATIDIDRPELWSWCVLNVKNFADVAMKTLACKTAGRGGVHLGLRTSEPLENTTFTLCGVKGGEIIAHNAYALYPRSELKGGLYETLFDYDGIFEFDLDDRSLAEFIAAFNLRKYTEPEPIQSGNETLIYKNGKPYGLSARSWRLLTQGDTLNEYLTRSEADQAVITECVARGWSVQTVKELFRRHSYAGAKSREKQGRHFHGYIERSYRKAEIYLAANKSETDRIIDALIEQAKTMEWPPRSGRISKRITIYLLTILKRFASTGGCASIREIAENTEIAHHTVFRHLASQRIPFISKSIIRGNTLEFSISNFAINLNLINALSCENKTIANNSASQSANTAVKTH